MILKLIFSVQNQRGKLGLIYVPYKMSMSWTLEGRLFWRVLCCSYLWAVLFGMAQLLWLFSFQIPCIGISFMSYGTHSVCTLRKTLHSEGLGTMATSYVAPYIATWPNLMCVWVNDVVKCSKMNGSTTLMDERERRNPKTLIGHSLMVRCIWWMCLSTHILHYH